MMIGFTAHARLTIQERGLALEWVERAILDADRIETDPSGPEVCRSFKRIPEAGDRIIRVVHRRDGADILVITAFLDRGAKL
ncbi:DUF4258 domain-containing protein [Azospirillum sp.]|uniref:DUF4258 domain-containing protein n=1 Tax=Azospirillum sp. TaxID=34012 RepID=UPI002D4A914D|nr:DUF4258 domain-containing protein [Azospirillum sp.]HYF85871.1 DUF4258 domain-containing protein [Azospirillum sp.]